MRAQLQAEAQREVLWFIPGVVEILKERLAGTGGPGCNSKAEGKSARGRAYKWHEWLKFSP